MNGGDKNNSRFLKAGMLPDQVCKLKTVEFRHAYVHQDHGDVRSQKTIERFAAGMRLEEVFAEATKNYFVAEQFPRLIVNHQNVYWLGTHLHAPSVLLLRSFLHRPKPCVRINDATTSSEPTEAVRYLPVLPNTRKRLLPNIFRGLLSWLSRLMQ